MSYEGYTQYLCKAGHYWTEDCMSEDCFTCDAVFHPQHICNEPVAWLNMVDITNGSYENNPETNKEERIDGYIELESVETKSCDKCSSILEETFKIPEKGGHKGGWPKE